MTSSCQVDSTTYTKRDSVTRFFYSGFFLHKSSSPKTLKIKEGPFIIYLKIRRDICKSMCTTCISETGGKFATGINEKFEAALMGYSGAWEKLNHEKNLKSKILWHCPFKPLFILYDNSKWKIRYQNCVKIFFFFGTRMSRFVNEFF
jgi:hypothetical protein